MHDYLLSILPKCVKISEPEDEQGCVSLMYHIRKNVQNPKTFKEIKSKIALKLALPYIKWGLIQDLNIKERKRSLKFQSSRNQIWGNTIIWDFKN